MYAYERIQQEKEHEAFLQHIKNPDIVVKHEQPKKRFVSMLGSMAYSYGNVLAWFQKYMLDEIMPENLFKTIHVNSKIAHRQIKELSEGYNKKTKPMIIFRPRIGSYNEERFLKNTALIQRQNNAMSTWGSTSLQPFFKDDRRDLLINYQQNRSVMYVDVIMVFATLFNQMDYVHYLDNMVLWENPQLIKTCLESYIPKEMLSVISDVTGVPLYDSEKSTKTFLTYMNQNSFDPVTYKLQGSSGTKEFYRYYPTSIELTMNDLSWDEGERAGQVQNGYQISFSARIEFYSTGFYYVFSDKIHDIQLPVVDATDSSVIPVFTDVITKEDLNLRPGWVLYNQASCRFEKEESSICIDELLNNSIRATIKYHRDNGIPLGEFLDIKIRKQGKLITELVDYTIDYDTMTVTFKQCNTYETYRFLICIDVEYVNNLIKTVYKLK